MKQKILITTRPPEACISEWKEEFDFLFPDEKTYHWTNEQVIEQIPEADALFLAMNYCRRDVLDAGKKLKAVGNIGVGYDNVDWQYATEKGIAVVNAPNGVTEVTAELVMGLIFAVMRSIPQYDRRLRTLGYCDKQAFRGTASCLYGKTVGIVGFGRIGRALCGRLQGCGMRAVYFDTCRAPEEIEKKYGAAYLPFEELLRTSDVVSLHLPYFEDTHHLMGAREFALMKPGSYFINAARGPIADEKALAAALKSGHLKGAGLDVHEYEPKVSDEMIALENVVLTPHIGTMVPEARIEIAKESLRGIAAVLRGACPPNCVNPEIFQK